MSAPSSRSTDTLRLQESRRQARFKRQSESRRFSEASRLPDATPERDFIVGLTMVSFATLLPIWLGLGGIVATFAAVASVWITAAIIIRRLRIHEDCQQRVFGDLLGDRDEWKLQWSELHGESLQTASVLAQMRDGVIVLAPDQSILLVNPSARRLLSFVLTDTLVNRPLPEVIRYPDLVRAVNACAAGDGAQEVIIEVQDNAVHRPVRICVDRIASHDAESNLLLTLADETESRRIDEIRREFIANVSHELKTPLAAIKGYAETVELAIEDDPAAAVHFMSQIQTQCLRLERLVADMMQLARAQAGRDKLHLVTVNLGDVLADSLKSYRPIAAAKHIELAIEDDFCAARVTADREATLTIVNNLIGNAVRYTPDGGHVRVGVREAGKFWALRVTDDGVGIPESEHERIFERFYRVEKTRESARSGTGLGLSIVKNLTIAQGGEVRLKSRPGVGSTFEVLLPAVM